MSLSRGTRMNGFQEGTARKLELEVSVAEAAPECDVNPNVLHRCRKELREDAGKAFPRHPPTQTVVTTLSRWSPLVAS